MRYLTTLFAAVLFLASCTSNSEDFSPVDLVLERTFTIVENDSSYIGDFNSFTVDPATSDLFVPDNQMHRVARIDSSGHITHLIGRRGTGPGELQRPMHVAVLDSLIYVKESNRFSVFNKTGSFKQTLSLSNGVYPADRWSLTPYNGSLYLGAADATQSQGIQPTPEAHAVAKLDSALQVEEMFAHYPEIYQNEEHSSQWRNLDISKNGMLALVFSLSPNVFVYDVSRPSPEHVSTVSLSHPSYRLPQRESPPHLSLAEKQEIALNTSATLSVWFTSDTTLVMHFANRKEGYYDNVGADTHTDHYAVVATTSGQQIGSMALPGPIMARDHLGQLYIRHSDVPDQREIGIYRVEP